MISFCVLKKAWLSCMGIVCGIVCVSNRAMSDVAGIVLNSVIVRKQENYLSLQLY